MGSTVVTKAGNGQSQDYFNDSRALASLIAAVEYDCSGILTLIGDSTGDESTDWLYRLLSEKLGPSLPQTCIRYCLWDDATQKYGIWSTLQGGTSGQRYARFDGDGGSRIILADDIIAASSSDVEIEIKLSLDDWTPAAQGRIVGRLGGAGNRGWYLLVNTNGTLSFSWSADGTALITKNSSAHNFSNGVAYTIRVKLDIDNGGGGFTLDIDTSPDEGANWTSIYHDVGAAGTTSIYATTANYEIGAVSGSGTTAGNVYDVIIRDGFSGPYRVPAAIEAWGSTHQANSDLNSFGGSPTLYVFNGSMPGGNIVYFGDSTRLPKMAVPNVVQCVILATGHNDVAYRISTRLLPAWTDYLTALTARMTTAGFVVLTENPRDQAESAGNLFGDEARNILHALPLMLQRFGVEVIDTYRAFGKSRDTLANLVGDGVHPTKPAGVNVWINEIWRVISNRLNG
jgi:hypothetical protein